ncbi:hypothetical protein TNCV_1553401 [Trichonephila clavipes]|nr:hypothetical protein TNCV_1553401 [Trichonephila clavipes]
MTTNTSQDVGRSGLDYIAIWTRRENFKTRRMPLSSSMSTTKPSKSSFISPTTCPKQNSTRMVSFIPLMYGGLPPIGTDTSCLTRVANSDKVRQPPCVEYLWLPSWAKPSAISFPQTFTCDGTY